MKATIATTVLLITGLADHAYATNLAVIASPPAFLNLIVLGLAKIRHGLQSDRLIAHVRRNLD